MYVYLGLGVNSDGAGVAVAAGASTSNQVAEASQCGRCRRTVRAIIAAHKGVASNEAPHRPLESASEAT
jgi:bacterioferritin-associated ferredoxin